MKVRFVGRDPGAGRQFDGKTYFPGDIADLAPHWVASLEAAGLAVRVVEEFQAEGPREVEIVHRDTFARAKRDKR
jgi:hypothetical protein